MDPIFGKFATTPNDSSTYKIPHHYLPLGVDEGSLGFFRIGEMEEEFLQSQGEVLPKRPPDSIDICQHNPRAPICPTLVKGRFQLNNFPSKWHNQTPPTPHRAVLPRLRQWSQLAL